MGKQPTHYKKTDSGLACVVCGEIYSGCYAKQEATRCCADYKPYYGQLHLEAVLTIRADELKTATAQFGKSRDKDFPSRRKVKLQKKAYSILKEIEEELFPKEPRRRVSSSYLQKLAYAYNVLGWNAVRNIARAMVRHYAKFAIDQFIEKMVDEGVKFNDDENIKRVVGQIFK